MGDKKVTRQSSNSPSVSETAASLDDSFKELHNQDVIKGSS